MPLQSLSFMPEPKQQLDSGGCTGRPILITPRLGGVAAQSGQHQQQRPVTASISHDPILYIPNIDSHTNTSQSESHGHHPNTHISSKAQDLLYGGLKHEQEKIYDKLGMTAKELATFKSAPKAMLLSGHTGTVDAAHSPAERDAHDSLKDEERRKLEIVMANKQRIMALTASKKAQEILYGKSRDKVTDKLGVSRSEINQFKTMNKAYQRLGLCDGDPHTGPLHAALTTSTATATAAGGRPRGVASRTQAKTPGRNESNLAVPSTSTVASSDGADTVKSPTVNSRVISINQLPLPLTPTSHARTSWMTGPPLTELSAGSPVASPSTANTKNRRVILQPLSRVPQNRARVFATAYRETASLPGAIDDSDPQRSPPTQARTSLAGSAFKKKAKLVGTVAVAVRHPSTKAFSLMVTSSASQSTAAALGPGSPFFAVSGRNITNANLLPSPSRRLPDMPGAQPNKKILSPVARSPASKPPVKGVAHWKSANKVIKAQKSVAAFTTRAPRA